MKKIIIGSANFNQSYSLKNNKIYFHEIKRLFKIAKKNKILRIDTSPNYKNSEKIIGKLKFSGQKVISKIGKIPLNLKKNKLETFLNLQVLNSIKNLKVKKLDCILIQNSDILLTERGKFIFDILNRLKKRKKIGKIGISIYDFKNLKKIISRFKIDVIQTPFSIVDKRLVDDGWLKKLVKLKIEVHVRSIFLQGVLLTKKNELPTKLKFLSKYWEKWDTWQKSNKISSLEACFAFVHHTNGIKGIVIGLNNSKQLEQIINLKTIKKIKKFPELKIKNRGQIDPLKWLNL